MLDDPGGGGNRPQQFDLATVTPNFFSLLGVSPALGRNFTAEEGAVNGPLRGDHEQSPLAEYVPFGSGAR